MSVGDERFRQSRQSRQSESSLPDGRSMVGGNVPTGHPRTRGSVYRSEI